LHTKSCPAKRSCIKIGSVKLCFTQECKWTATRNHHIRQQILMQQDTEDFYLIPTRSCEFCRCRCSKSRTLIRGSNEFLSIIFAFVVRFLWNSVQEIADKFLKNRSRKSHNFLIAENEIVFTYVPCNRVSFWKQWTPWQIRCISYGVHHSQSC